MSGMSQKQKEAFDKLAKKVKDLEDKFEVLAEGVMRVGHRCDEIVKANLKTIEALEGKRVINEIAPLPAGSEEKNKCR
jgi:archaellum component FlaC